MTDAFAQRLDTAVNQAMTAAGVPGSDRWNLGARRHLCPHVRSGRQDRPRTDEGRLLQPNRKRDKDIHGRWRPATGRQGKFGLDDPIAKFVDGVPQGDKITLRQLARMQSGLFNYTESTAFQQAMFADPRQAFTPHELLNYGFAQPNRFPPGDGFECWNTTTVLLGVVVEKVSGQPLHSYIQDHLVTPLGMSHTTFRPPTRFPNRIRRATPCRPRTARRQWSTPEGPLQDDLVGAFTPDGTLVAGSDAEGTYSFKLVDPATLDYCYAEHGQGYRTTCARLQKEA
jgi:D-alanyl-D-alanine carboxypeptidase